MKNNVKINYNRYKNCLAVYKNMIYAMKLDSKKQELLLNKQVYALKSPLEREKIE